MAMNIYVTREDNKGRKYHDMIRFIDDILHSEFRVFSIKESDNIFANFGSCRRRVYDAIQFYGLGKLGMWADNENRIVYIVKI